MENNAFDNSDVSGADNGEGEADVEPTGRLPEEGFGGSLFVERDKDLGGGVGLEVGAAEVLLGLVLEVEVEGAEIVLEAGANLEVLPLTAEETAVVLAGGGPITFPALP